MSTNLALDGPITEYADAVEQRLTKELSDRGYHFSEAQRLENERTIARMLLEGSTINDIASRVGIAKGTVYYYVKKIESEWRLEAMRSISDVKAKELAKLDKLEATAWDAWERSKLPVTKNQLKTELIASIQEGQDPQRIPREARTTKDERVGDPKYLDIIFKCIDKRMKIFGLSDITISGGLDDGNGANKLSDRLVKYKNVLATEAIILTRGIAPDDDPGEPVDHPGPT